MTSEISILKGEVDASRLFDFGTDAFGTLEVELDGVFDENVEIVIGEAVKEGKIIHETGFRTFLLALLKLKKGHHTYRFPIPEHIPAYGCFPHEKAPREADGEVAPFRYVEINHYYGKAVVRRTAWFGYWNNNASAFECSDSKLKKIWDFCKYTIQATSLFDRYVDGERERMPYEADAYINQLGHFCCDAMYETAKRTIDHFMKNGRFTWPTEWVILTPILIRDYLLYSGDRASVDCWLPQIEEKLLPQFMTKDGLLSPSSFDQGKENFTFENGKIIKSKLRDIIDWPESERDGYDQRTVNFVPNACLYGALLAVYELTGKKEYLIRAEALKKAIRKNLMKPGMFLDSIGSNHTALHSAMFALHFGLAEGAEIEACRQLILSKRMDCSVYGAQFLLDACFGYGMEEHAISLMTDDGPRSWNNMLREGATMTMETWSDSIKMDQDWCHPWGAAPANIITRRLCGIRPAAPGFTRFSVLPHPGALQSFSCIQPTLHGPIVLKYSTETGYDLTVPAGTVAEVFGKELACGTYHLEKK